MVEDFSFIGSGKLLCGPGKIKELENILQTDKALLICGLSFLNSKTYEQHKSLFSMQMTVKGEPSPQTVDSITEQVRGKITKVVAIGGGSVLDTGKAVAAMCCSEGSVEQYLEGVGTKQPDGKTLPMIAIPTTAGTGSEATKNAVICQRGPQGYKKSLRHDSYIPYLVIIDPELYLSCPANVMASCGMDAFSQLLESYISTGSNSYTDTLAWKGLTLFLENFPQLIEDKPNLELMEKIAFAAYLSGITLANAGLGTIHGIAGPLGGFFPIPHGTACGTLLPEVIKRTVDKEFVPKLEKLGRFIQERHFIEEALEPAQSVTKLLENWQMKLKIPRLSQFGIKKEDLEKIVSASGNKNHPVLFSKEEMISILEARL